MRKLIVTELLKSFWPPVADDPEATEDQREISRRDNAIEKIVVSDSLTAGETDPWRDTTRIVPRADARAAVTELKRSSGDDVLVFGSRMLWNELLTAGLPARYENLRLVGEPAG